MLGHVPEPPISSSRVPEPPISPCGLMILKATTVVYDGYGEGPPIKDDTYQRRGLNIHTCVSFTAKTLEFSSKKEEFLLRDINKQRLIRMICDELR